MGKRLTLVLLTSTVLLGGCVVTNSTRLGGGPALRPIPVSSVAIYRTAAQVPGTYEEIALLNSEGSAGLTNEQQMHDSMRREAAALGADGIILDAMSEPSAGAKVAAAFLGVHTDRRGRAIAIRMRERAAPEANTPTSKATTVEEQTNARAQFELGVAYAYGRGVQRDDAEAMVHWRKAAELGHAEAQYILGLNYSSGKGVARDYVEAYMWHSLAVAGTAGAAQKRNADSRDALAELMTPEQLTEAQERARAWTKVGPGPVVSAAEYRARADQGETSAQFSLGEMYATGRGVPMDYGQAVTWFRKAAEQGDAAAQYKLGEIYVNGKGVLQDHVEAHKWMNLAASRVTGRDHTRYASERDTLATKMTAEQLATAQKRAREWAEAFEMRQKR